VDIILEIANLVKSNYYSAKVLVFSMIEESSMNIEIEDMLARSAEAEAFLKQLANSKRLMILCVLSEGELSVGDLNQRVPLSQSALSQHLAKLRAVGFVSTRRESQSIYYKLSDPRVVSIIQSLYQVFCEPQND
jgi:DNA-binding transcriptional ArsR family regulator